MKISLRLRYVLWLLAVMVVLFIFQILAFTAVEIHEWREWGNADHVKDDVKELIVLLGIDVVVLPFVILVSWAISGRMLQPLLSVAETSRRISFGNLNERVMSPVPDEEISSLVQTINSAFDKYQDALRRMQQFTSDASHQMRTPLAALRGIGEVSLGKERTPAEYRDTLGAMLEEVARLSTIVEKLLLLARLERSQVREEFRRVDVARVVNDVVQAFTVLAQDRRVPLALETSAGVTVDGDADLLRQVFANLIDNAIRYTPPDGAVRIQLARDNGLVRFVIADSGPGVPAEFRNRIFERFGRAPGAVGQGCGLGLAIVADIVRIHGGTVELNTSRMGGAEFRITLPSAPAAAMLGSDPAV